MALTEKLTAIADAIRGKTGKTDGLTLDQMPGEIAGIQAGGGEVTVEMLANHEWPAGIVTILSEHLGAYALQSRKGITALNAPNLVSTEGSAFHSCSGIEEAYFPKLKSTTADVLTLCTKLRKVDFGECTALSSRTFVNCTSLDTIILRVNALVPIHNLNALENTPFRGYQNKQGTVYCPAALIEQYRQATNWATLYAAGTCNFVAIEGSEYE